jgi:predicted transcriptional regulator
MSEPIMRKNVHMSIKMEPELHEQFMLAASNKAMSAEDVIRDLMRGFVSGQNDGIAHDAWFRRQVKIGIDAANAGDLVANDEVENKFSARRAKTLQQLKG